MTASRPAAVIILAAGEGTRMKSTLPKVLHPLCGRSMLGHAIAAAQDLDPERLIVVGLSSKLPASLSGGLISNGVPAATANTIGHLPPIGVLFAAFLGYNPIKQLLGSGLGHLSAAHASYLTGRDFFPTVITQPFKDGLTIAFWFAIAASVIAAIASLLTTQSKRSRAAGLADVAAEPLGEELASVAGEGGWEPSELVIPAEDVGQADGRPAAGADITGGQADGRRDGDTGS